MKEGVDKVAELVEVSNVRPAPDVLDRRICGAAIQSRNKKGMPESRGQIYLFPISIKLK